MAIVQQANNPGSLTETSTVRIQVGHLWIICESLHDSVSRRSDRHVILPKQASLGFTGKGCTGI
jgi:hypothetical protein